MKSLANLFFMAVFLFALSACQSDWPDEFDAGDFVDAVATRVDTSTWSMDCTVDDDCIAVDDGTGNCVSCCPEKAIRRIDREQFIEERSNLSCDSNSDATCFCGSDYVARCNESICQLCEVTDNGENCVSTQ